MNKVYKKSKSKYWLAVLYVISIYSCGIILVFLLRNYVSLWLIFFIVILNILSIIKLQTEFKEYLEIGDSIKLIRSPISWHLSYDQIICIKIKYLGLTPPFNTMVIESTQDSIYIDAKYYNYKMVWKEIIEACIRVQPNVFIDPRILKKLHIKS